MKRIIFCNMDTDKIATIFAEINTGNINNNTHYNILRKIVTQLNDTNENLHIGIIGNNLENKFHRYSKHMQDCICVINKQMEYLIFSV